jgi:DNA-binding response OmpR family regulator
VASGVASRLTHQHRIQPSGSADAQRRAVVSKQSSERALGRQLARYDRSIDMHMSNLRRKLGTLPDRRSPIQTVRGVGCQFIRG